jgi:hypothetical protein
MKSVSVSTSTSTTDVQKPIEVTGLVQEYIMESIQNDFSDSSPEAWIAQTVTMYYNVDFNYILLMNKLSSCYCKVLEIKLLQSSSSSTDEYDGNERILSVLHLVL